MDGRSARSRPSHGCWASRNILLPSTDITDIVTLQAFTTRIICQDSQGVPPANSCVILKSTSPVGVYVNDLYHTLSPETGFTAVTDLSGTLTIVQPTQDMNAICYTAALVGQQGAPTNIDPSVTVKGRLAAFQSGSDLQNAQVMQKDGTTRPLRTVAFHSPIWILVLRQSNVWFKSPIHCPATERRCQTLCLPPAQLNKVCTSIALEVNMTFNKQVLTQ